MDAYKNVMDMMGGDLKVPERRKDKRNVREVIEHVNKFLEAEFRKPCRICGKEVLMPKDHDLCLNHTPINEGGNFI